MYSEIGSEFWSVPLSEKPNDLFDGSEKWFISGTAALEYILDDIIVRKKVKSAGIPSWCCSSMIEPFVKRGLEVRFFPVTVSDNDLSVQVEASDADVLLLVDYFGYNVRVKAPENYGGIVIRDETHSVFSGKAHDADYYFASLRKWAGFWTGGFARSEKWNSDKEIPQVSREYVSLRKSAMEEKLGYLNGETSSKSYLNAFGDCEDFLDNCGILAAEPEDIERAAFLDIDTLKTKRRRNAEILIGALKDHVLFREFDADSCPLFVPIIVRGDKRDALRQHLTANRVYCPVHWGISPLHGLDADTRYIYEHEISLVCDQRYDEADMEHILSIIASFNGGTW